MTSIFSNIYKYREKKVNQRENYLTEIFAYCLNSDEVFFKSVLRIWNIEILPKIPFEKCKVLTQQTYYLSNDKLVRPDMVILLDNHTLILVEIKVGSTQGSKQLDNYHTVLELGKHKHFEKNKHLVFLTKYKEKPDTNKPVIESFWYHIARSITDSNQQLTKELKSYLKEENMTIDDLKQSEIQSLIHYESAFSKMDAILHEVGHEAIESNLWDTRRRYNWKHYGCYADFVEFQDEKNYIINLGVGFYSDEVEVLMYVDFFLDKSKEKKAQKYQAAILDKLGDNPFFEPNDDGSNLSVIAKIALTDLKASERFQGENNIAKMIGWLNQRLNEAVQVTQKLPKISLKKITE